MTSCTETNSDKNLSVLLSSTLDNFGFNRDAISFRAKPSDDVVPKIVDSMVSQLSEHMVSITLIGAGSRSEGTSLKDGDSDFMFIFNDTICVDTAHNSQFFNVLKTEYTDSPPGYTKLESVYMSKDTVIGMLLRKSDMYRSSCGHPFISSTILKNFFLQSATLLPLAKYDEFCFDNNIAINGPACTAEQLLRCGSESFDLVVGFYYYGKYISQMMNRNRLNIWPPDPLLKEISEMEGFVVPVGLKESENVHIEWRICYTTAEKKLIESFNDTQMKLYVLLKIMAKHMRRKCKPFTSYIVKNVVFWVVEGSAQNLFSPDSLIFLVKRSLWFINHCLYNNYLPNYMIPERNMFTGSFSNEDKRNLGKLVSGYLEGDIFMHILHTNIKLQKCVSYMKTYPSFVNLYGRWRDKVEQLALIEKQNVLGKYFDINLLTRSTAISDLLNKCSREDWYIDSKMNLLSLLVPDWILLYMQNRNKEINEKYDQRIQFVEML